MSRPDQLSERLQHLLVDIQHEVGTILASLQTTDSGVDSELLEKVFTHHLHRAQESIIVLCKLLEDYEQGRLDTASLLVLAQWT